MADIFDIVPNVRKIKLHRSGENDVDVPGLSVTGLVSLFVQHPEIRAFFEQTDQTVFDAATLASLGGEVAASFMAAGLGHPGDQRVRDFCKKLNPEDTWNLVEAIFEESFPGGAENFFKKVVAAMGMADQMAGAFSSNSPSSAKNSSQADTETLLDTP